MWTYDGIAVQSCGAVKLHRPLMSRDLGLVITLFEQPERTLHVHTFRLWHTTLQLVHAVVVPDCDAEGECCMVGGNSSVMAMFSPFTRQVRFVDVLTGLAPWDSVEVPPFGSLDVDLCDTPFIPDEASVSTSAGDIKVAVSSCGTHMAACYRGVCTRTEEDLAYLWTFVTYRRVPCATGAPRTTTSTKARDGWERNHRVQVWAPSGHRIKDVLWPATPTEPLHLLVEDVCKDEDSGTMFLEDKVLRINWAADSPAWSFLHTRVDHCMIIPLYMNKLTLDDVMGVPVLYSMASKPKCQQTAESSHGGMMLIDMSQGEPTSSTLTLRVVVMSGLVMDQYFMSTYRVAWMQSVIRARTVVLRKRQRVVV